MLILDFLICHDFLLYHLGFRALFCSLLVWLEYYKHNSVRQPRFNYYLCLTALEIVQLGKNTVSQLGQISGGLLHLCSTLPWWLKVSHFQQLLLLVVVYDGPGALLM